MRNKKNGGIKRPSTGQQTKRRIGEEKKKWNLIIVK